MTRWRIWHIDAGADPDTADGQSALLWRLAAAHAHAGHDVTLFCYATPSAAALALARTAGLRVVEIRRDVVRFPPWKVFRLGGERPDIVNLHSAWVPSHAAIARWCRRLGVPYSYASHGGHTPALLAAGRVRRRIYLALVERPTARAAASAIYASDAEAAEAARLFGAPLPRVGIAPFPAPTAEIEPSWRWQPGPRPVVYLGRYDVFQKGIDGLCEVARHAPEIDFELHGAEPTWTDALAEFRAVRAAAPPNAHFCGPITGEPKRTMLAEAGLYLQYSRFEGFPLAVTEAMASGLPVCCAERLPFAREAAAHGAVALVADDPAVAAGQVRALLADRDRLEQLSAAALDYVRDRTDLDAIAERHLAIYASVLRAANDR